MWIDLLFFLMLVLKGLILPLCDGYIYEKRLISLLQLILVSFSQGWVLIMLSAL